MTDDPALAERPGVTVEAHLLRRHAADLDHRLRNFESENDLVVNRRRRHRRHGRPWGAGRGDRQVGPCLECSREVQAVAASEEAASAA